jgi:hypothetical protein
VKIAGSHVRPVFFVIIFDHDMYLVRTAATFSSRCMHTKGAFYEHRIYR